MEQNMHKTLAKCEICGAPQIHSEPVCSCCGALSVAKCAQGREHPYYAREFAAMRAGCRARFNVAAFFGGAFHCLYYGCWRRFLLLQLPYLVTVIMLAAVLLLQLPQVLLSRWLVGVSAPANGLLAWAVAGCVLWGLMLAIYHASTFNEELYRVKRGNACIRGRLAAPVIAVLALSVMLSISAVHTLRITAAGWYEIQSRIHERQKSAPFDRSFYIE